jgi:hypothetical protein
MLQREAASLAMPDQPIRDLLPIAQKMEAGRLPKRAFCGAGQGRGERRGEGRAVAGAAAETAIMTGGLRRAGWGISGAQRIGGSIIRICLVHADAFTAGPA